MRVKHDPSRSPTDFDMVCALACNDLPENVRIYFKDIALATGPNHRLLNMPDTLRFSSFHRDTHTARKMNAYYNGGCQQLWLSERTKLMLVYMLLKLLKTEYCKPKFGDNFITFHIKTAMLFTIERKPPDIWPIDNIVVCATYFIDTLIPWAHDNLCHISQWVELTCFMRSCQNKTSRK